MDSVLRGAIVYAVVFLLFRVVGKRALAQITTFDLVLLLIISEAIQEALLGTDYSMTNAFLLVVTLLGIDVALSLVNQRSRRVEKWLDDVPLVIVDDGRLLNDRLNRVRINESEILHAARELQGLERLDQIKYAVLERGGGITIIPKE